MTDNSGSPAPPDDQAHVRESIRMLMDLDRHTPGVLAQGMPQIHPRDIALVLQDFTVPEMLTMIRALPTRNAAEAIIHADPLTRETILAAFDETHLAQTVLALESDDAADLLQSIHPARRESVLTRLPDDRAGVLRELSKYDPESAGGVMTTHFVAATAESTVAEAFALVRSLGETGKFSALYVIDSEGRLRGTVSAGRLIGAPQDARLSEVMDPETVPVRADDTVAAVVAVARKHRAAAVPVVEPDGRLAGIVTQDDIVDAAADEAGDDILRMGGAGGARPTREPFSRQVIVRLPWLLITLSGGMVAAMLVGRQARLTAAFVALLCFLPAVTAMGANAGIAASAAMLAGMATGEVDRARFLRLLRREIVIGVTLGILLGLVAGFFTRFYLGNQTLGEGVGLSVGIATAVGIVVSACLATAIVLLSPNFGVKPSTVAGPLVIIVSDVVCVAAYLGAAGIVLSAGSGGR